MKLLFSEDIDGVFEFIPTIYPDDRGHFFESYNKEHLNLLLSDAKYKDIPTFVQENQSFSKKGVLRGLHFQKGQHAQGKLVRVITGSVIDVAVDLRPNSPTYLNHQKFVITEFNQVYLPPGLAHGFYALADTIFIYKCTTPYCGEADAGIHYADPTLKIEWELDDEPTLSPKDLSLPTLTQAGFSLPTA